VSILGHSLPRRVDRRRRRASDGACGRRRAFARLVRGFAGAICALSIASSAAAADVPPAPARPSLARTGGFITYEPRPTLLHELRACSFRHPLCVHADAGQPDAAIALLDAADRAWDVATGALDLPAPDADFATTGALDIYLVAGDAYVTRVSLATRDPRGGFDRASAFALVGAGGAHGLAAGCSLDAAAARVVARAVLFRVAPSTDEGSALAESGAMASLMVPCAPRLDEALTLFQARPDLGLADTLAAPSEPAARASPKRLSLSRGETYATGASLFYDWLDDSFGGYPGAIVRTMWALSPTSTPLDAARWNNEPDGFDVLRVSFKNALTTGSTVDDLWLAFAVGRAFDPTYPVRHAWDIAWPATPRTLLAGVGVAPTGAAYIGVDCALRPKGSRLRFEAQWEEHARMLWTLVRIDAAGRELSRVAVPGPDRGNYAQTTLVDLDGVARVLAVGINAGDPLFAFDPDDYDWEPHGWVASLASE
jgi:hypothetical protein